MGKELYHFFLHLRLHYQFFILSGGYLLGGLLAGQMDATQFWLQFFNVHILLFGGATAYNSYWDKDEGPIGGLKRPPKMTPWMHSASLVMMFAGLFWAWWVGFAYTLVYGVSLLMFWLYSTPLARWKGHPELSLVAIMVSTGLNSVLLGFWAAGGSLTPEVVISACGASLILLSLYPASQVYQAEEDKKRGDTTFTMKYGLDGVKRFFTGSFLTGLFLLTAGLFTIFPVPAMALFIVGLCSFCILLNFVLKLRGFENEYRNVMKIKFFASLSFVLFLLIANGIRHEWIGKTFLNNYF